MTIGQIAVNRGMSFVQPTDLATRIKKMLDRGFTPREVGAVLCGEGIERDDTLKVASAWKLFENFNAAVEATVEDAKERLTERGWSPSQTIEFYVAAGVYRNKAEEVVEKALAD